MTRPITGPCMNSSWWKHSSFCDSVCVEKDRSKFPPQLTSQGNASPWQQQRQGSGVKPSALRRIQSFLTSASGKEHWNTSCDPCRLSANYLVGGHCSQRADAVVQITHTNSVFSLRLQWYNTVASTDLDSFISPEEMDSTNICKNFHLNGLKKLFLREEYINYTLISHLFFCLCLSYSLQEQTWRHCRRNWRSWSWMSSSVNAWKPFWHRSRKWESWRTMTLRRFVSWVQATEELCSRSPTDPLVWLWQGR